VFNTIFLMELLINMYGNWGIGGKHWCSSGWNRFDFLVVTLGTMDLFRIRLPGQLGMVRMLRAFRIFRLFGRVTALKKIVLSLIHSFGGMYYGLVLLTVVTCIFSSLAVDLYGELYCGSGYSHMPDDMRITARDECFGHEYYGNFLLALYTMFQILTGESWSEAAVRPVLYYYCTEGSVISCLASYVFFVAFILTTGMVLLNVFAVCLLDAYSAADSSDVGDSAETRRDFLQLTNEDQAMAAEIRKFKELTLCRVRVLTEGIERVAVKLDM